MASSSAQSPTITNTAETPAVALPSAVSVALRRQQALVAMGRRAIAVPELSILLQDAATLLAEVLELEHYSFAEVPAGGETLTLKLALVAAPPTPARILVHSANMIGGESLAAYTLKAARPVVLSDLGHERRFSDTFLKKQGIVCGLSTPLMLHGQPFGTLAAYGTAPREFSDEDLLFAEALAHLLTTSIARHRAERSLREERRLRIEVLQTLDSLVLTLTPEGEIRTMNRAGEVVTGFAAQEIRGRLIWNVFPVPEETQLFQRIFDRLRRGISPVQYESFLLTKHGQRRRLAWSYGAVVGENGELDEVVATGIDVTRQHEAEEKYQKVLVDQASIPGSGEMEIEEDDRPGSTVPRKTKIVPPSERRIKPRRPYPYQQLIAPIVEGELPERDDFVEIRCHDISSGGFSFISSSPPAAEAFVVALGQPPTLTYLTAQVAHVTRMEHEGQRVYLIGCNYVDRAQY